MPEAKNPFWALFPQSTFSIKFAPHYVSVSVLFYFKLTNSFLKIHCKGLIYQARASGSTRLPKNFCSAGR